MISFSRSDLRNCANNYGKNLSALHHHRSWAKFLSNASLIVTRRAPLFNSSYSFLGHSLYGPSRPRGKASCGDSCKKAPVSVNALVDIGADVHILSYDDARKMFTDVEPSSLRIIGVYGSTSRAASQGSLVANVQLPTGICHRFDLGTAHSIKSCPTNLLSPSRLVDVGAVLNFEKGECRFQPPPRFTDQGESESERIPLNLVGGLYDITFHKLALDLDTS